MKRGENRNDKEEGKVRKRKLHSNTYCVCIGMSRSNSYRNKSAFASISFVIAWVAVVELWQ